MYKWKFMIVLLFALSIVQMKVSGQNNSPDQYQKGTLVFKEDFDTDLKGWIAEFQDKEPLWEGYFGFRTTKSRQVIDDFRIYALN